MTSTLTRTTLLLFLSVLLLGSVHAQSQPITGGSGFDAETGFEIPQYDTQEELIFELVVPFLFISILLHLLLTKVLHWILRDDDYDQGFILPAGIPMKKEQPDVSKYATLMSITITAMLVPTTFWTYITWAIASIGLIAVLGFAALVLFIMYLMSGLWRE